MQPTGGFTGNDQNASVQQQQMLQMQQMYQQYGQAMPHMQQPNMLAAQQQAYGMQQQQQQPQQQYVMPGAAMPRPVSATPPPGIPQQQQVQQPQQQPGPAAAGNAPRQSADGADGGDFDFDNIPSPTASPAGAGAGPAAAQQQPQQSLPFPGGQGAMGQAVHVAQQQQQQQQLSLQHQQQMQARLQAQQAAQQQQQAQQRAREDAIKAHHAMMQQQGPVAGRGTAPAAPAAQRMLPSSTAGMTSAQAALASADAEAAKGKKGPIVVGPPGAVAMPPGVGILQAGALGLHQHQLQQQQQQQQQLSEAAKKRKRADALLLPPPEDALSLEGVFARARMAGGTAALAGLPGMPPSVAAAAGGAGTDGPALSVDEILRRPEYQRGAAAAAAAGKPGSGGAAGFKAGRGRDGRRDDESRVLPESQLRRLMELQGLNKAFRMQPELQEQLIKLTETFVSEAVDFGCALAARRRGATLRPSDLALFMQRSHHIYVPGFNKEYRQYKRPVPSELHKARTILVRKAQLHPQQQAAAVAGEGGSGGGKAGGVRFSGAE